MREAPASARRPSLPAILLALLAAAGAHFSHDRLHRLREGDHVRARAALGGALSAGELLGATLLGGFRAIAINIVWIRITNRFEEQSYQDLPVLYAALEALQARSPFLYRIESEQMVLDIPRHLPHRPDERWAWICRGLAALERGRSRFPGDLLLLREAEYLYYQRFHPQRCPGDRDRFLVEPRKPGDLVQFGRDPLELAREAGEEALAHPDHPFDIDQLLWASYGQASRLLATGAQGTAPPGPGAAARQRDYLARAARLLAHAREAHQNDHGAEALLREWERQMGEIGR